jgi:hypothetical protein
MRKKKANLIKLSFDKTGRAGHPLPPMGVKALQDCEEELLVLFVPLTLHLEGFPVRTTGEPTPCRVFPNLTTATGGFPLSSLMSSDSLVLVNRSHMLHHRVTHHFTGFNHLNLLSSHRISYSLSICEDGAKVNDKYLIIT